MLSERGAIRHLQLAQMLPKTTLFLHQQLRKMVTQEDFPFVKPLLCETLRGK